MRTGRLEISTERRVGWAVLVVALGGLMGIPFFEQAEGQFGSLNFEYVLTIALVAIGMNVVLGYAGQLTLGPGAVFGAGAYGAALVAQHFRTNADLPVMIVAGMAAGVIAGAVVGAPSLRIGGFYLANTTLLFALALPAIVQNTSFLGGAYGFEFVGRPQYPSGAFLYELIVVILILFILFQGGIRYSRVGRRMLCIGASPELGASVGISAYNTKLLALVLSSIPAGVAGALYVYSQQLVTPNSVSANLSFYILAAIILGGFGTIVGPVIGSIVVVGATVFFSSLGNITDIAFGVLLILLAMGAPNGIGDLATRGLRYVAGMQQNRGASLKPSISAPSNAGSGAIDTIDQPTVRNILEHQSGPGVPSTREIQADGILVSGVSRAFGGVRAVDEVDLRLEPGEVHALVGSNGSGKTTLLNLISGFYRVDRGTISVDGTVINGMKVQDIAVRARLSRTFQTPKLLESSTLRENIQIGADSRSYIGNIPAMLHLPEGRRNEANSRAIAESAISAIGLGRFSGSPISELPHGLRRIAEVGRALTTRPRYLLLDEPAAGLSRREMEFLRELVLVIADCGVGVLLIEHNLTFVRRVASRVTVMDVGRVVAAGRVDEVLAEATTRSVFLGSQSREI